MDRYIEIAFKDGAKVYLKSLSEDVVPQEASIWQNASFGGKMLPKEEAFLNQCTEQLKSFSNQIAASVNEADFCPDEFEIEFSVSISADAGIVISRLGSEASFAVKMKWNKSNHEKTD